MGVFLGDEVDYNRLVTYLERDGDILMGTCGITISRANPRLAGFGEVATRPDYRGRGIASRLCGQAVEEFVAQGGEAVFLGTGNPDAARIYHRLGWRRIAGTNVWARVTTGDSPEEYLADYFRAPGQVSIVPGDASLRVPMIPLLVDAARLAGARRQSAGTDAVHPLRRAKLVHGPVPQILRSRQA